MNIKCGHCKGRHTSFSEVKSCAFEHSDAWAQIQGDLDAEEHIARMIDSPRAYGARF